MQLPPKPPHVVARFLYPLLYLPAPISPSPLTFELVSDYSIDPDSGLIFQHRLVATRVNGQLTAADVMSRWIQNFLKMEGTADVSNENANEKIRKGLSDAISWFRRASPPPG